jgi:hypothetical protein
MEGYRLSSCDLGLEPMVGFSELGSELSDSIKEGEFLV